MTADFSDDSKSGEARRFLLGELAGDDAESFEARLLGRNGLYEEVEAAEDELFDEFVRNELTPDERSRFLERFGDQEERITFARTLDAKMRDQAVIPFRRPWEEWARQYVLAAASMVVVVGAFLFLRSPSVVPSRPRPLAVATSRATSRPASATVVPAASVATLEIALMSARGSDRAPHLALGPGSGGVALRIRLNPADRFPAYSVLIRRSDGSKIWTGQATLASPGGLVAEIPSQLFASGDYEIAVAGVSAGGSEEDLGYRTITVDRRATSP